MADTEMIGFNFGVRSKPCRNTIVYWILLLPLFNMAMVRFLGYYMAHFYWFPFQTIPQMGLRSPNWSTVHASPLLRTLQNQGAALRRRRWHRCWCHPRRPNWQRNIQLCFCCFHSISKPQVEIWSHWCPKKKPRLGVL